MDSANPRPTNLSASAVEFVPRAARSAAAATAAAPPTATSATAATADGPAANAGGRREGGRNNRRSDGPAADGGADGDATNNRRRGGGGRNAPAADAAPAGGEASAPAAGEQRRGVNNRRRGGDSASAAAAAEGAPNAGGDGRRRNGRGGGANADNTEEGGAPQTGTSNRRQRGGAAATGEEGASNGRNRGGDGRRNNGRAAAAAAEGSSNARNSRASRASTATATAADTANSNGRSNARGEGRNKRNGPSASAAAVEDREMEAADNTPFITSEQAEGIVSTIDGTAATKQICTELLTGEYECVLCLVPIRSRVATWSCGGCYHVFHLSCVKHWAKQPESGSGKTFRCPHCQAPDNTAAGYFCYCTKQRDPKYDPNLVPHSCGESCGKKRGHACDHPCPSMCHPGPCPPCPRFNTAQCPCGATSYDYGCDKADPKVTCDNICGKLLPCGNHTCTKTCHNGPCGKCDETQSVACVCGKESKELPCGSEAFHCEKPCDKTQRCGEHKCPVTCHSGNCPPCDYDPSLVDTCPCGKELLIMRRRKCTEEIPTCGSLCGKALLCGNHICEEVCHTGPCKPCNVKILAKCRCGQVQAKVLCKEREAFRCEKKCKGAMKCGKHECPDLCCAFRGKVHPNGGECPRVCGKQLLCGHSCSDRCHPGMCQPCPNVITSVLQCRCGNQQLIPPLACGTLPPRCYLPCTLPRPCGHAQTRHDCHYDECPPCMHLVKKRCDGGHKDVEVFCHTVKVSCGAKCGRPLPCGHSCDRLCHDGPCRTSENEVCKRPCGRPIDECGHFCTTPCHSHKPNVVCKCATKVSMPCECGLRSEEIGCAKYQKLLTVRLEAKAAAMAKKLELESSSAASASAAAAADEEDFDRPLTIECNADCAYHNRLTALAARSAPKVEAQHKATIFSLRLWEIAGNALDVVGKIETKLNEFVRNTSEVSMMMAPMPKDRRIIVHELANFYNIKCESVDNEPNRTCYLTKTMKSRIPTPQLTSARINKVHADKCDPTAIIRNVITSQTLAPSQTLIFRGDKNLNEIAINGYLKEIIGSFVAVQSEDAYGMLSNLGADKMHETLFDAMDEFTFFAVFATKFDTDAGFALLRKTGCPVLYQRVGAAPPPAKHYWEPRRDPSSGEVIEGEYDYDEDNAEALAAAQRAADAAAAQKSKTWGEMFSQPRLNAKQRKDIENSKVELTGGAFAALAKRK